MSIRLLDSHSAMSRFVALKGLRINYEIPHDPFQFKLDFDELFKIFEQKITPSDIETLKEFYFSKVKNDLDVLKLCRINMSKCKTNNMDQIMELIVLKGCIPAMEYIFKWGLERGKKFIHKL